jgi:hypothetical protein
MGQGINLRSELVEAATQRSAVSGISVEQQIELWVRLGQAVERTLPSEKVEQLARYASQLRSDEPTPPPEAAAQEASGDSP